MLYIVYIVYTVVNLLNLTSFGASFNCTQKTAFEYMNNIRYKTIICLWESERERTISSYSTCTLFLSPSRSWLLVIVRMMKYENHLLSQLLKIYMYANLEALQ